MRICFNVIIFAFIQMLSQVSFAICVLYSKEEYLKRFDYFILAEVEDLKSLFKEDLSKRDKNNNYISSSDITLKVKKVLKGKVKAKLIKFKNISSDGDHNQSFEKNKDYIFGFNVIGNELILDGYLCAPKFKLEDFSGSLETKSP